MILTNNFLVIIKSFYMLESFRNNGDIYMYVRVKKGKQTSVYENSKQKMRPRKKVRCQDGKMCKKIHCVCFYSTVNFF